ncbi:MAG: hypothetical protein JRF33_13010 [Deltaproteobacteria bacterium]|nr:hypothetical protein [Deltaproteobacteria bacterium]
MKRPLSTLGIVLFLFLLSSCDVFLPEKGDLNQPCLGNASSGWKCKPGLACIESMNPPTCVLVTDGGQEDAGLDAGEDGGADAGLDAAEDAGVDAGGDQEITCFVNGILNTDEICDPQGPVYSENRNSCEDWGFVGGSLDCTQDCQIDSSGCHNCGDLIIGEDELCDFSATPPVPTDYYCSNEGFFDGILGCTAACELDLSGCHNCGNGSTNEDEECDDQDMPYTDCQGYDPDYISGSLSCNADCSLDLQDCYACGNEQINPELNEVCEDALYNEVTCESSGFDGGQIACAADCLSFDFSDCIGCGNGRMDGDEECESGVAPLTKSCADLGFPAEVLDASCSLDCTWNRAECNTIYRAIEMDTGCAGPIHLNWAPANGGLDYLLVACASGRVGVWSMAQSDHLAPLTQLREVPDLDPSALGLTLFGVCLMDGLDRLVVLMDEDGSRYLSDLTWTTGNWTDGSLIEMYAGQVPDRLRCAVIDGHFLAAVIQTGDDYGKIYDIDENSARLVTPLGNATDLVLSDSLDSTNLGHLAISTDGAASKAGVEIWNLQDPIGDTLAAGDFLNDTHVHATALCPDGSYLAAAHEEDMDYQDTFTVWPWVEEEGNSGWWEPSTASGDSLYGDLACRPNGIHDFFAIDCTANGRSEIRLHPEFGFEYTGARDCGPEANRVRMEFSPNGNWLATWVDGDLSLAGGPQVRIWHVDTLRSELSN